MDSPDQKRKRIVKQAIANERLEGLKVFRESQKIAGKMSAREAAKKIRARCGTL